MDLSCEPGSVADDSRIAISVVAALGLPFFSASAMPLLLGAISEQLSLGSAQVGLLGTLELAAMAVFAIGTATLVARQSRVRLALIGCVVAGAGHLMSALPETFAMLAFARVVAGAGMGIAAAAAQAAVAGAKEPDRVFGIFFAASTLLAALLLLGLPYLLAARGYEAGYVALALTALLACPLIVWLPRPPRRVEKANLVSGKSAPLLVVIPALLTVGLIAAADFGMWSFIELIGTGTGISPQGLGESLAAATLAGSVTAASAAWLGTRFGRILPIILSFTIMIIVANMLPGSNRAESFVPLVIIWSGSLFVAYVYVSGAVAAADASGRWSAAAAGARLIGGAIGPAAAGLAVGTGGYQGMGLLVSGWCGLGLLLAIPLAAYLSRVGSRA